MGSSPRVRGRHHFGFHLGSLWGLIPASAGQTDVSPDAFVHAGAHPRECGADTLMWRRCRGVRGSSPRVRGRRQNLRRHHSTRRLIPASAGQTTRSPCPVGSKWAHPRECGADVANNLGKGTRVGSSPRVRGRRGHGGSFRRRRGAHPRECGADRRATLGCRWLRGSSPRVRGRRPTCRARRASCRLIPASAGQTLATALTRTVRWAHPRECGADVESEGCCA